MLWWTRDPRMNLPGRDTEIQQSMQQSFRHILRNKINMKRITRYAEIAETAAEPGEASHPRPDEVMDKTAPRAGITPTMVGPAAGDQ